MNILYFHGLDSEISIEKRKVLEKYGKVFSPAIDYRINPDSIAILTKQYREENIKIIVGSSMGGFVGYYIADAYSIPALLFNPAMAKKSVKQNTPEHKIPYLSFKQIVLGGKDDVIDPRDTLKFISENFQIHTNYRIHIHQELKHQIPVDVFEKEVKFFFENI